MHTDGSADLGPGSGCGDLADIRLGAVFRVVPDAEPHRRIYLVRADIVQRDPADFGRLGARRRLPPGRPSGQDDRKLLAGFAVSGVEAVMRGHRVETRS